MRRRGLAGKTFTVHNQFSMGGVFVAPNASFTANDDLYFGGSMIFKNITLHDRAQMFNDETLSGSTGFSSNIASMR